MTSTYPAGEVQANPAVRTWRTRCGCSGISEGQYALVDQGVGAVLV